MVETLKDFQTQANVKVLADLLPTTWIMAQWFLVEPKIQVGNLIDLDGVY